MTTTMKQIVDTLLANKIQTLTKMTNEVAEQLDIEDFYWPDYKAQWVVTNTNYLLLYTDDDGVIADVNIISQIDDKTWSLELFDGRTVDIETDSYSSACDLSIYKRISFDLNEATTPVKSNKDLFVEMVLYSNKNVIADDILYQDVQHFIDLQDKDFFDDHEVTEAVEMFFDFIEQ